MNILIFLSQVSIPLILFYIVGFGILMKCKVYEEFVKGAKDGLKTVAGILPTLIGLMVAGGGVMNWSFLSAGLLDEISLVVAPVADGSNTAGSIFEQAPFLPGHSPVGLTLQQSKVLEGETGMILYSYYLPEGYDPNGAYPLVMAMPGYDMMWFGEDSSGSNLDWPGFLRWTQLPEDMIVVSAQLTDWGETSARQAVELTEYFIQHYAVPAWGLPVGWGLLFRSGKRGGGVHLHGGERRVLRLGAGAGSL